MEAHTAPHMGNITLQDAEEEAFVVGQLLEQAGPGEAEHAFGLWTPPQTPNAGVQPTEEIHPEQNDNPLFLYEVDGEDEHRLMPNGLVDNGPDGVHNAGTDNFGVAIWRPNELFQADEETWLDPPGVAYGQIYPFEEEVGCERADCTFC